MTKGIGRLFQVGIAKESSRGIAEALATYYIPFSDSPLLEEKQEQVKREQSHGVIEGSIGAEITKEWAEGQINAPIGDRHFGLVLLATLGACTTVQNSDPSGLVYDHDFQIAQSSQHPSLTVFMSDPLSGQDYKHSLGVISSLEIKYDFGKIIEYTAGIMAKKGETASLTPSTLSEHVFTSKHFKFEYADNKAGLSSPTEVKLKSLKFKINKNVESDDVLGSSEPVDFINKRPVIEGSLEAVWQNEQDFKEDFIEGNYRAIKITLEGDETIGTSTKPKIEIILAKVKMAEVARPINNDDVVTQSVKFEAHYSVDDAEMVRALLTNLVANY